MAFITVMNFWEKKSLFSNNYKIMILKKYFFSINYMIVKLLKKYT